MHQETIIQLNMIKKQALEAAVKKFVNTAETRTMHFSKTNKIIQSSMLKKIRPFDSTLNFQQLQPP